MNKIQKALVQEAQSSLQKDPVYAKELLVEALETNSDIVSPSDVKDKIVPQLSKLILLLHDVGQEIITLEDITSIASTDYPVFKKLYYLSEDLLSDIHKFTDAAEEYKNE